jgi:hypothetical protein
MRRLAHNAFLARDPTVVGESPVPRGLAIAGWIIAILVGVLGLAYVVATAVGW